ncbi:MAG: Hsp70 family protein [Deltaproteobacteria bacterium]|nr:Hsp70 family protein [Deltaproteobacteria bacterium]
MVNKDQTSVIGIDFGTTNTYLTICPYGTKNKFPLHISGRSPAIDTAILYAEAEPEGSDLYPVIGERATITYGQADKKVKAQKGYRYYANFKPEIVGHETARRCAVDFFKAIKREALRVGVTLDPGANTVIIGAPSEAGKEFRETLIKVVAEAGLGQAEVVDEPKGVLLTDLGYNRFPLADILDGYLVVDFGGGTCDFALMQRGEVVGSWGDLELGGRLFDDLFYQWFLDQHPNLEKELIEERRDFYVWSYSCRQLKEEFSETVTRNKEESVSAEVGRFGAIKDLTVPAFLERASKYKPSRAFLEFGQALGVNISSKLKSGGIDLIGWFTDTLLEGLKDNKVRAVSLSGGSSKWFFVREICQSLLKIKPERILGSPNPFGAISEGLSILPAVKIELETARRKMMADKDSFIAQKLMAQVVSNLEKCTERLAGLITHDLFDLQIVPIIKEATDDNFKISDIDDQVKAVIDNYQERLRTIAQEQINIEILAIKTILQVKVQDWLNTYGLRLEGRLPSNSQTGELVEIDRPLIGEKLIQPLVTAANGSVAVWSGLIAASVCGGSGLAILATGPLGLFLGALGGLGLSGLGLRIGRERIERLIKEQKLPKFLVKSVISDKNIDRVRTDFKNDIVTKVNKMYHDLIEKLPIEIDAVIVNEIKQLGIINVF